MQQNKNRKHKYLAETQADKQLRRVLLSLIGSIVLCMTCLIGSTWAWFQTTITSEGNVITIGQLQVSVELSKGELASRSAVMPSDKYTYELEEVGTYKIILMNTGDIPGYCTITLTDNNGNKEEFTSGTLYPTEDDREDTATIYLNVTAEDIYSEVVPVTVVVTPHWGDDPNYAVASLSEDGLFLPTEPETTDETLNEEDPDYLDPTDSTDPVQTTDPTDSTEVTEPPATTEGTEPPATTEPETTEPDVTTEPTEPETTEPEGTTTEPTVPATTEPETTTEPTAAETTQPSTIATEEPQT